MGKWVAEPLPDMLIHERKAWRSGYVTIAGVDEVGRGALAGPLVAAAVILPSGVARKPFRASFWHLVRDSKTVSASSRTILAQQIHAVARSTSIAIIPVDLLDAIGLAAANRLAMERAVFGLAIEPDLLLVDAMTLDVDAPQFGLINGDAVSLSIAAASIVAKVARDTMMIDLDAAFPAYGFARNKGYGVPSHTEALERVGPCVHHRTCFAPARRVIERLRDT